MERVKRLTESVYGEERKKVWLGERFINMEVTMMCQ
jgi:hypothetical protein